MKEMKEEFKKNLFYNISQVINYNLHKNILF